MSEIERIQLKEFLNWVKAEIIQSEDELPPIKPQFETNVPATESRNLYFKTRELEIEVTVGVTKTGKAGIQAWILQLGGEKGVQNTQIIRIKLDAHGYRFPSV